ADGGPGPYRRPTPIPGAPRARRCAVSRLRGPLLGYDDEHLGTRKRREAVLQGYVVVPLGHDRDASRPAADRDLAVPAGEIAADPGEALTAARIAEPAHALDQRAPASRGATRRSPPRPSRAAPSHGFRTARLLRGRIRRASNTSGPRRGSAPSAAVAPRFRRCRHPVHAPPAPPRAGRPARTATPIRSRAHRIAAARRLSPL